MTYLLNHIIETLSAHFNETIQLQSHQQVFGGDINQAFKLQTNIGPFFLKLNDGRLDDMFQKEFEGLHMLYQTQDIKIPAPILYGKFLDNVVSFKTGISSNREQVFLITEFIEKGNIAQNFWKTFAYQLAALHKHANEQFGLRADNYIGSLSQVNNYCNTWSEFYASQRIMPLMQLAFNQNKCSGDDLRSAERLCQCFDKIFPEERPALIHGDLWIGNFMSNANGKPVIYDPAVYYGNREMDIAMSLLFGGFDRCFYDYYNEAFPLQPGWKERVEICQLYPLIVHLILFGGHYYYNVMRTIDNYL